MSEIRDLCNLSDEDFEARRKELRETLLPRVTRRDKLNDGVALFFEVSPEMRQQIDAFIEFERECCSGLQFSVADNSGALRLEILGIDPDAGVFAEVNQPMDSVTQAERTPSGGGGGLMRGVRSIGLGGALAFFLCCILPLGIATLVGVSIAAPLMALDNPLAIGTLALAIGVFLWRRENKRDERNALAAEDCGC